MENDSLLYNPVVVIFALLLIVADKWVLWSIAVKVVLITSAATISFVLIFFLLQEVLLLHPLFLHCVSFICFWCSHIFSHQKFPLGECLEIKFGIISSYTFYYVWYW